MRTERHNIKERTFYVETDGGQTPQEARAPKHRRFKAFPPEVAGLSMAVEAGNQVRTDLFHR